jgi:tripartite-type tricarboxylate transporter receptor subunit TctC
MSSEVASLLAMSDTRDSLARQGIEPFISTSPERVTAFIRAEIARYGKIIKTANIKLESGN